MPTYEYCCQVCGEVSEHHVPMAVRNVGQNCPKCGTHGAADLQLSAPMIGTERIVGDSRIIKDERQVTSERGERWRDEGTTGEPGGVGRRIHFHT